MTEGRRVTAHTLFCLREHLKRRGIEVNINFKVRAEEFLSHTVTLCEICYNLTVAEHHLMEIEKQFAKALGIPVKVVERIELDVGNKVKVITKQVLFSSLLYMWRVMFYFKFINTGTVWYLSIDNWDVKGSECYLQFKLFESITRYPLVIGKTWQQMVNKIRVHYFFSESNNINEMLRGTEMELRITKGTSWDKVILEGKSLMLANLSPNYLLSEGIIQPKTNYLFNHNKSQYIVLKVII